MKKLILQHQHFAILFVIGLVVKFFFTYNLQFNYDEVSALLRTNYQSFGELIEKGVKPDGHPAGMQVFLWFWIKIFGDNILPIRLFTLIIQMASVVFFYRIVCKMFNQKTAEYSVVVFLFSSFFIITTSTIRPYSFALFFVLLFYWKLLSYLDKKQLTDYLILVFAAVLASSFHYFAALQVVCISLVYSVLKTRFFLDKKMTFSFFMLFIFSLILYLPQLPILMHQLAHGGLAWLGKPNLQFFKNAGNSILIHYSLVLLLFLTGLLGIRKNKTLGYPFMILFAIFSLPTGIGFLYSTFCSPVLHLQNCIFSIPFFLPLLFVGIQILNDKYRLGLYFLLILFLVYNTTYKKLFTIQKQEPYSTAAKIFLEKSRDNKAIFISDMALDVLRYHIKKQGGSITPQLIDLSAHHADKKIYITKECLQKNPTAEQIWCFLPTGSISALQNYLYCKLSAPEKTIHIPFLQIINFNRRVPSSINWKLNLKTKEITANEKQILHFCISFSEKDSNNQFHTFVIENNQHKHWRTSKINYEIDSVIYHSILVKDISPSNNSLQLGYKMEGKTREVKYFYTTVNPYLYGIE